MKKIKTLSVIFFALLFIIIFTAGANAQIKVDAGNSENENGIEFLATLMEGSFSSQEQSLKDTNYFDIRLHMKRIWKDRTDGIWFYVEQASALKLDKPYRQRVYHLTKTDENTYESSVFTYENPLNYAGDWKKDYPLAGLNPDKLSRRDGCSVFLKKNGEEGFSGSTMGTSCESDLKGAKYATSEVVITKNGMVSWDRGFNEKGEQVWGAETSGYIFKRVNE